MNNRVLYLSLILLLPLCLCQVQHHVRHHKHHQNHHKRHANREAHHNRDLIVARSAHQHDNEHSNILYDDDLHENDDKMSQDDTNSSQKEMDVDYYHKIVEKIRTSSEKPTSDCPKCQQNGVKVSEEHLTELRIEFVKNQILQKLRLTERPPQSLMMDVLPKPIADGDTIQVEVDDRPDPRLDDFYAKTTQKIIFLTRGEF